MKQTRKGKNIEKLLREGYSLNKIVRKGYSPSTVRYYKRKIYDPKKFTEDMDRIKKYNKKNYAKKRKLDSDNR